jgi:hypothetical protein
LKLRLNDSASSRQLNDGGSSEQALCRYHPLNLSLLMFGNTGIQSSWANPQPNQQQPQQPQQPQSGSVFGQPSAFGSGGGGGGASFTLDTFSLPLSTMFLLLPRFWIWRRLWPKSTKSTTATSAGELDVWKHCIQS